MSKLQVGIAGSGMIARIHARCLLADQQAELIAVCNRSDSRDAFAREFGIKNVFATPGEMLDACPLDLLCVCTPSGVHHVSALDALQRGVHVLCEKPLDIDSARMTEMIDTAAANNVWLGCVFPNRTRDGLRRAKEIIDSGQLGKMLYGECVYRGYRSLDYYRQSTWKGTRELDGGGALMNQSIHAIDTFCWLAGRPVAVSGIARTALRPIEVEDLAMGIVDFDHGASGLLLGTTLSHVPNEAPEGDRIFLEFERGSILYEEGKANLYRRISDEQVDCLPLDDVREAVSSGSDATQIDQDSFQMIVSDMISAILENRPPCIPGEDARRSVDLVLALYASSKVRRKVSADYRTLGAIL